VRYGLFLTEEGGAIDDVTAYRVGESEVLFCVNASNAAKDLTWVLTVRDQRGLNCDVIDESDHTALLAIQGPAALAIAHDALGDTDKPPGRWKFRTARFEGAEIWLSRTGYTGEDGYEIYAPGELAAPLWDALVKAGEGRLRLAGLGARDTLRTEMAYPLYGHELDPTTDPLSAGLERFVAFGRGFIGEPALQAIRDAGPAQRLVGLLLEGRAMARVPASLYAGDAVGRVTSGTFAPSIERSIAIGYVPARLAGPGSALEIEVRGRRVPCQVCKTPFYSRKNP
jgi:aminomethyltransferase